MTSEHRAGEGVRAPTSSASRLSRSRWFVGSSRTSRLAPLATTSARASRRRSPPESARHRLLVLLPAREEEAAEELLRLGAPQAGRRDGGVEHRAAFVELLLVLGEVRGLDAVAELDPPRGGLAPAEHRLEQRRLARAVRADERHVLAALERERSPPRSSALSPGAQRRARRPRSRPGPSASGAGTRTRASVAAPGPDLGPGGLQAVDLALLRLRLAAPSWPWRRSARRTVRAGRSSRRRGRRCAPANCARAACSRRQRCHGPGSRRSGRGRARAPRSSPPRGTSGRARPGSPRRRSSRAALRATRSSRCRGGSSARRAAAGRAGRRARGPARRASARRPRTSPAAGRGRPREKPRPRTTAAARSRQS